MVKLSEKEEGKLLNVAHPAGLSFETECPLASLHAKGLVRFELVWGPPPGNQCKVVVRLTSNGREVAQMAGAT
jgi:hypothetical protein